MYIGDGDAGQGRVLRVGADGVLRVLTSSAAGSYLGRPRDLAVAPDGMEYVADEYGGGVHRVTAEGSLSTITGPCCTQNPTDVRASQWYVRPAGVAVAPDGTVYVTEFWSSATTALARIRRIGTDGIVRIVAGNGSPDDPAYRNPATGAYTGSVGDGGPAVSAILSRFYGGVVGGGLLDDATRLVRFGTRDYDPATGRWTSIDPLGFGGGTANPYEYVRNDPINGSDPTGLAEFTITGLTVRTNKQNNLNSIRVNQIRKQLQRFERIACTGASQAIGNLALPHDHHAMPKTILPNEVATPLLGWHHLKHLNDSDASSMVHRAAADSERELAPVTALFARLAGRYSARLTGDIRGEWPSRGLRIYHGRDSIQLRVTLRPDVQRERRFEIEIVRMRGRWWLGTYRRVAHERLGSLTPAELNEVSALEPLITAALDRHLGHR